MKRLPTQLQTAYAELLDQLVAIEAQRSVGQSGGGFVLKRLKGAEYVYYQHALPGGIEQAYVGRRSPALDRFIERFLEGRGSASVDRERTAQLCAILRAGGATSIDAASARVLAALADAAVFHLGGVLVGTQAFVAIGTMLGLVWAAGGGRTDDIDIAGQRSLAIAVPAVAADVPGVLESLEMGFLPVPGLSPRHPSTSFKVRGRPLRVDILTTQVGRSSAPVPIPRFRTAAQPLRHLDYLLEDAQPVALVAGSGVLVNVPSPARFALHKLVVSRARPVMHQAKSAKDLDQAAQLVEVLAQDRPGDLGLAWKALASRPSMVTAVRRGIAALESAHRAAHRVLAREVPVR